MWCSCAIHASGELRGPGTRICTSRIRGRDQTPALVPLRLRYQLPDVISGELPACRSEGGAGSDHLLHPYNLEYRAFSHPARRID